MIAATTTKKGLTVRCELDSNSYIKGVKVSDAEMATLNIERDPFHPEWNYTIKPRRLHASEMKHLIRGVALDHPDLPSHLTVGAIGFVADTYLSDIAASTAVLRQLLEPARIQDHGHEDLPWLARKIRAVWEADPDFAVDIYGTTFGTAITDRRKTSISGSRILPLTSNRQQDFGMAGFALKEAFPHFLSANPSHAVSALIRAFERYVSVRRPVPTEAQSWDVIVNGHIGELIEDGSRYWAWNPNEEHGDNTAALLKAFADRLRTLPGPDVCELATLVIRSNRLAVIWSRLFMVAAQRPAELGSLLWPYAIQWPFLLLFDTRKDAVDLIAARYPFEGAPAKEALENAALSLDFSTKDEPERQRQALLLRLFRTIGRDQLVTAAARSFLDRHESDAGSSAANPRPFSVQVSSHAPEEWWWLKHQGVAVEAPLNADLLIKADQIKSAFGLGGAPAAQISDIPAAVLSLRALVEAASAGLAAGAARAVADYAVGMAAAGAKSLAYAEPARLRDQPRALSDLVALTLELTNHPAPEAEPDQELRFEGNQSWGFPAARIDAAEAAIILCRVDPQTAKRIEPRLDALLHDSHPGVRFLVSEQLPALWDTARGEMWRLARQVAETESQPGSSALFRQCLPCPAPSCRSGAGRGAGHHPSRPRGQSRGEAHYRTAGRNWEARRYSLGFACPGRREALTHRMACSHPRAQARTVARHCRRSGCARSRIRQRQSRRESHSRARPAIRRMGC